MRFQIEFSPDARAHLGALRKFDQRTIVNRIEAQLVSEPLTSTRNRKEMRSNAIATWELRVEKFRVYYDVEDLPPTVLIRAIGIKVRNRVLIGGEEVDLE